MVVEQRLIFDSSGLDAAIKYLKNRTSENFHKVIASPGNIFAYRHFQWSNMDSETMLEDFWARILAKITDEEATIRNASAVKNYLLSQSQTRWLPGVLEYLPRGHVFDAKIYLNLGYDNVAYGGDVALNLNHKPFHSDNNESIYYLMHELAHAGYLRYHEAPDLKTPGTLSELAGNVMYLTQLEGMGVLTPMKLRTTENRLTDPDYVVLNDPDESKKRVKAYFQILKELLEDPNKPVHEKDLVIYDQLSCKPRRLWYISGCQMAQAIEVSRGVDALRELVKSGSRAFFETYYRIPEEQIE